MTPYKPRIPQSFDAPRKHRPKGKRKRRGIVDVLKLRIRSRGWNRFIKAVRANPIIALTVKTCSRLSNLFNSISAWVGVGTSFLAIILAKFIEVLLLSGPTSLYITEFCLDLLLNILMMCTRFVADIPRMVTEDILSAPAPIHPLSERRIYLKKSKVSDEDDEDNENVEDDELEVVFSNWAFQGSMTHKGQIDPALGPLASKIPITPRWAPWSQKHGQQARPSRAILTTPPKSFLSAPIQPVVQSPEQPTLREQPVLYLTAPMLDWFTNNYARLLSTLQQPIVPTLVLTQHGFQPVRPIIDTVEWLQFWQFLLAEPPSFLLEQLALFAHQTSLQPDALPDFEVYRNMCTIRQLLKLRDR